MTIVTDIAFVAMVLTVFVAMAISGVVASSAPHSLVAVRVRRSTWTDESRR
jgi:hypothetical protein